MLGGLEVNARLEFGSEKLFLFLTQTRLILAHKARVGRAGATLTSILGRLASGAENLERSGGSLQKLALMKPDSILGLDSGNFAIYHSDVVSFTVDPAAPGLSRITLLAKDRKVELSASAVAGEGVRSLLVDLLGEKVSFRTF